MALSKKAIFACLAFLWLPFCWTSADGKRQAPNQVSYPRSVQACSGCHQKITDAFIQTAHFKTSAQANAETIKGNFAEGHNILQTRSAGTYFKLEKHADGFYQTGFDTTQHKARTERIDLVIGSSRKGQSYLYWENGLLFQLPVSYLVGLGEWINSPGYLDGQLNFERVIGPRCLECHSTYFKLEQDRGAPKYASNYALGIGCEKCHGDGSKHVEYQTALLASHPTETSGKYILNPARFLRERKLDSCALCHSGGWEPSKPPFSYTPGERLDAYAPPEASQSNLTPDVHGNQIGLLKRTKCFRASQEMSCSTCHDVHRQERDLTQFARKCLACHQTDQHKFADRLKERMMSDCIDCHMPNQKSNLIQINTPTKQFSPYYRSHAIGIYPKIAEAVLQSLQEKQR